jgi:hypothetical protein
MPYAEPNTLRIICDDWTAKSVFRTVGRLTGRRRVGGLGS